MPKILDILGGFFFLAYSVSIIGHYIYQKLTGDENMDTTENNLTEGSIIKGLLRFALPLFLGNLFQQLYNLADSLIVGNFCGKEALAAVSSSGSLCFLLIGFFQGVFVGASVIISRKYGAKDEQGVDIAIHNTVIFSLVLGVLLTIFGVIFTPQILKLMGTPTTVLGDSIIYFRIYCGGLLGLVLYNTTNGIFQALGDSKHPLYYLIISSCINVVLDLFFVGVLHWGVAGAALATIIGQTFSALLGLLHLMSGKFIVTIRLNRLKPDFSVLKQIVTLGFPTGIQNSVISIANVVVQANINAFGDAAMAGCGSYMKIESFMFIPVMGISLALTTFVSQNLGANKPERAKRGSQIGIILAVIMAELFGVLVLIFAPYILKLFTNEPEVISYGIQQMKVVCLFYFGCAFAHAVAGTLRGAGKTTIPMGVMLLFWCVVRIIYITILVKVIFDIRVVFSAYPVTWVLSDLCFAYFYLKGDWIKN